MDNTKEIEQLQKDREGIDAGLSSLKYNPEKVVMDNIGELTDILHSMLDDIDSKIEELRLVEEEITEQQE